MSGVELKPIGISGGSNILVPLGATTIGRGPFLGVADKRVSRNHAVFDVADRKLRVKPIHVNPTFFQKKGTSRLTPLAKDTWQDLQNGDQVALTPNEHMFEVVIDETPVYATQSPRSSVGSASPIKSFQNSQDSQRKQSHLEEEDSPSPARKKLDFPDENKEFANGTSHISNAAEVDGKPNGDNNEQMVKGKEEEQEEVNNKEILPPKEFAKPLDRVRQLPDWMKKLSSTKADENVTDVKPKGRGKPTASKLTPKPAKKKPVKDKEEVFVDFDEEKASPKKQRGRPKGDAKRKVSVSENDDEEIDQPAPKIKRGTSSRGRTTISVSYVDDWSLEDDEEFILRDDEKEEEDDDDKDSDWEESSQTKKKGKGKSKGKSPITPGRGRKRKGKRGKYSDSEESDEEVYIPKPTRRRGGRLSGSQQSYESEDNTPEKKIRNRGRKKVEEESNDEEIKTPRKEEKKEKTTHEESGGDDKESSKGKAPKSCQFGKKCYRKNPAHFEEFLHPGDAGYKSGESEESDENRPECEYGTECYRNNPDHRKEYKHTKQQRHQPNKKSVLKGDSDDDGGANTYDYNDSFLDQEEEASESPYDPAEEDSDWQPDTQKSGDNVEELVKEAKGFIKNKKMHQKVT